MSITDEEEKEIGEANASWVLDQCDNWILSGEARNFDDCYGSGLQNVRDTVREQGGSDANEEQAIGWFQDYLLRHGARQEGFDWVRLQSNPQFDAERAMLLRVVEGGTSRDQPKRVRDTGATLERMGYLKRSETRGWWLTEKGLRKRGTAYADNPKRPPKHWWRGCVRGVRDSGRADDPESVCGSIWYHQMTKAQRRAVLRTEGKSMNANPKPCTDCAPALLANPMSGTSLLLLAAGAAFVGWLLLKPKPADAAPGGQLPPGGPAVCPFSPELLDAWGKATGNEIVYVPANVIAPGDYNGVNATVQNNPTAVVVMSDGSFWVNSGGVAAPAPSQKDSYCAFAAAGAPQTAPPPIAPASQTIPVISPASIQTVQFT